MNTADNIPLYTQSQDTHCTQHQAVQTHSVLSDNNSHVVQSALSADIWLENMIFEIYLQYAVM